MISIETRAAAVAALDFPDGPGWFAGIQDGRKFVVWFSKFEIIGDKVHIVWGDDGYTMHYSLDEFRAMYRNTKWFRLHMPWDELQAQQGERWEPVESYGFQEIRDFVLPKPSQVVQFETTGRLLNIKTSDGIDISVLLRPGYSVCRLVPSEAKGE